MILDIELQNAFTYKQNKNTSLWSIANKYCEGNVKRTLKRELKELKDAGEEASVFWITLKDVKEKVPLNALSGLLFYVKNTLGPS